jgi:hypothetical protein
MSNLELFLDVAGLPALSTRLVLFYTTDQLAVQQPIAYP